MRFQKYKHKIYYFIFFFDIDYLLYTIELKLLQLLVGTLWLGMFSPFFVLSINYFVLPSNFIISGVCNSSLYPSFILNTKLLLFLLMYTGMGGIVVNISCFLMI